MQGLLRWYSVGEHCNSVKPAVLQSAFCNRVPLTCAEQLLQVCVELLGGGRLQVQRDWLQLNLPQGGECLRDALKATQLSDSP